ncbi:putative Ig domain-containing protein [Leptospira sp. 201903071]|uniref:Ig domain-containing protein n=1 Tax=Leptospira ainazelensis TaxID=2810034 RepID=UPI001965D917|nr:Ig domain-containing protein [Leptospira ainazelensis]MBM9498958.1 putative Ig domain-containing protein [Leptospira ainazelensis]
MKKSILKTLAALLLIGLVFSCEDGKKEKEEDPLDAYLALVTNPIVLLGLTCKQGMGKLVVVNSENPSETSTFQFRGEVGRPIHSIIFAKSGAALALPDCNFSVPSLTNNALANGLSYDSTTGTLSGTPTATMAATNLEFSYSMASKLTFASVNLTAQVLNFQIYAAGQLTCVAVGGGKFGCPQFPGVTFNTVTLCQQSASCGF